MGGGGFFGGLAGAIGDHLHEQHLLNLQNQIQSKANLLDNYKTLLSDPHMADVHGDIIQAMLKAAGTDPTKLHKQIGKPGGEFDPTQWQVLAQQRHAGQAPSPVNQGQNPTQIPGPPPGHPDHGQPGPTLPSFNDAQGMVGQQQPEPVAQMPRIAPPPGLEQSRDALPPTGGPAPESSSVVGPQASQAVAGSPTQIAPPPVSIYQGGGSLTPEEVRRRNIGQQTELDEAKYATENRAMLTRESALARQKTEEDLRAKRGHVKLIEEIQQQHPDWPMPLVLSAATGVGMAGTGATSRPVKMGTLIPAASVPAEQLLNQYDQPIDASVYPHVQGYRDPMTGKTYYEPTEIRAEFTPHLGISADGTTGFQTASNAAKGRAATSSGFVAPSLLPTERISSGTTDLAGNTRTVSQSRKTIPKTNGPSPAIPLPPGTSIPALAATGTPRNLKELQRSDQSYNNAQRELDTVSKPVNDLVIRVTRLRDTLNQNSPQADALVAPELLTVMSGGAGSGLRMNEAEIQRIVGGRSQWQELKSKIDRWQLDPTKPFLITPEQRTQIRNLAAAVSAKATAKQDAVNTAYQSLGTETDPMKHRQITTGLRRALSDIDQGKTASASVPEVGGGGTDAVTGLPDGAGKTLDRETALKFYRAAGGDPARARQLAQDHNWNTGVGTGKPRDR